jgi:hypothetical protein
MYIPVVSPAQVDFQPRVLLGALRAPCFSPRRFDSLFAPSVVGSSNPVLKQFLMVWDIFI